MHEAVTYMAVMQVSTLFLKILQQLLQPKPATDPIFILLYILLQKFCQIAKGHRLYSSNSFSNWKLKMIIKIKLDSLSTTQSLHLSSLFITCSFAHKFITAFFLLVYITICFYNIVAAPTSSPLMSCLQSSVFSHLTFSLNPKQYVLQQDDKPDKPL